MTILNVLEKIEENGFEAYIVGGYVRDYLLGLTDDYQDALENYLVKLSAKNLTAEELSTFKSLYVVVGLYSVVSFPFINLNGILTAHERFVELKLADLFHKVFIIVAMVICLLIGQGVLTANC